MSQLVGLRIVAADEGRVTFELDAGPEHSSPPGTLHGGILCDLADAAMGCAVVSVLDEAASFATVELKINFLKPVLHSFAAINPDSPTEVTRQPTPCL